MDITTRAATPVDAPTVHALTQAAFATLHGEIDPPSSAHLETVDAVAAALAVGGGGIAEVDGEAVGVVRFKCEDNHLYVGRVAVNPERRGLGVARALLAFAERHAASIGLVETRLEVRRSLTGNVAMFERLGYTVVAEYPHPKQPASTVLMLAKLISSRPSAESADD